MTWQVIEGDALAVMASMPDNSVDLIATDPPYGIGYVSSWTTRMDGSPRVADASFGADVFDASWLAEAARVLRPGGALYLFTRWDVASRWRDAVNATGLKTVQRIVWDKSHWGMGDLRYYGSQTEDVLFAVKGDHRLRWQKREGNVWRVWKGEVWRDGYTGHPTQKPVAVMSRPIEVSCPPGGIVLDPFCGSGSTGVAAQRLGRDFIGIEIDAKWVARARERIGTSQPALVVT